MMAKPHRLSLLDRLPAASGRLEAGADLSNMVWFRTGGPAEVLFRPAGQKDLQTFLKALPKEIPIHVIGVGSNLLIRDKGIDGVVIKLGKPFSRIDIEENLVTAGAGAMDVTVAFAAADAGLTGLEFLRGIPGTVGGALSMNAGAYGAEVADVLVRAKAIDRVGEIHQIEAPEMGFSYRKTKVPSDWIFIEATFRAKPGERDKIKARMEDIQKTREKTQPMRVRTGGSTFKNTKSRKAWELIEEAGCRGLKIGGAMVSEKHCNFLINLGEATSRDLEALGEEIRRRVRDKTGTTLEWEIQRVGMK